MKKEELEKEFERIIRDYGGIITKICYSFSSDSDEFKDLKQETLYNIWKGLNQFRKDAKLSTWIYRISFNTCISFQRKEKRINKVSTDLILNIPEDSSGSKIENYNEMLSMIQKLNYGERAIILMWLDDLSYEEIGELTGQKRNTIASKLKRIKEKLIQMNS